MGFIDPFCMIAELLRLGDDHARCYISSPFV